MSNKLTVPLVVAALLLFLVAVPGMALPFNPLNIRPITVGATTDGPCTPTTCPAGLASKELQDILSFVGFPNNVNDQSPAGMFKTAHRPGSSTPTLEFEFAGNAPINIFGIWSGVDDGALTLHPVFNGAATGLDAGGISTTAASLSWDMLGRLTITGNSAKVATDTDFVGINPTSFGFYLQVDVGGPVFYSVDALNSDKKAHFLAYNDPGTHDWLFGMEDLTGGDNDFNDMVTVVESIDAVPEPAAIALLGTALLACVGLVRRRRLS